MIVEPSDLPARRVLDQVRARWDGAAVRAEHLPVGVGAFHWMVGDAHAPRWFATADVPATADDRLQRVSGYDGAATLAAELDFVLAPTRDRNGRIAVDLSPGYLLSVTRYAVGSTGDGSFADDDERAAAAALLGRLHAMPHPPQVRPWAPAIGWRSDARRAGLVRVVRDADWTAGPLSPRAGRLLDRARPAVEAALRRFDLLVAAVRGAADRWVLTHGAPHTANLLRTEHGLRLVGWEGLALAPRERDLRTVLSGARTPLPLESYVAAGGRPGPLSSDTVELFDIEWRLGEVAEHAVRLARPHAGDPDDVRALADLESQLAVLRAHA